ncbi:CCA tRNA nucleotidyltransferase [Bosea sp. (in: a-proteobacteria)]|uniref:CCA tRNA nucleotidyltransferase n=1 Tax=Bosea sp. (in: a-proteobacteria) TaxID=1871050 RepID=UPI0026100FFD|nr:CCA tRNA nucleotidyltransferase [Bosea sp. (in: a-proteobacteria)]MCO5091099.1 CCA tRNA nucleotidyltransferase [Bosea sp. (in: a-proteobacteria)]
MKPKRAGAIARFLAEPALARLLGALDGDGEETRIVGGAVRNLLLGEPASDVDLATTALPEETMRRGRAAGFKAVPTGIEHGTVTLVAEGAGFEVTTLRSDVETDGRRAKVAFGRDFTADAVRRDFTINALGLSRDGTIHDYCGGLDDLKHRRVRFIGDAGTRIREDYLRILRFFRFHARYGAGEPDRQGLGACIAGRAGLAGLSRERVRAELMKLLVAPGVIGTLRAMAGAGLIVPVIGGVPHLARFSGVGDADPIVRLAALAVLVSEDAARLRERLRLSNTELDRIERIARALEALGGGERLPSLERLRQVAGQAGRDAATAALALLTASAGEETRADARNLAARLELTPPFLPGGHELMARGIPAGPWVGRLLDEARRLWIEAGAPAGLEAQLAFLDRAVAAQRPLIVMPPFSTTPT